MKVGVKWLQGTYGNLKVVQRKKFGWDWGGKFGGGNPSKDTKGDPMWLEKENTPVWDRRSEGVLEFVIWCTSVLETELPKIESDGTL